MNNIKIAAKLIAESQKLLFLTSAGMSADSNIPTFRDKNGYWNNFPPFKEKRLEAQDLASPWAFRNVLKHSWAFYEWRRRNAANNSPHEGYHVINNWMNSFAKDAFIHTTNTDGYHIRSGNLDKIMEVHGSMWRLQCLNVCSPDFWEDQNVPLCELNEDTMEASNYPRCIHCSGIARPHILMFGDIEYVGYKDQEKKFNKFMTDKVDMVILVGSSGTVPTNDYIALSLKKNGAKVININPDINADTIVNADIFLPYKSREAFIKLDEAIHAL